MEWTDLGGCLGAGPAEDRWVCRHCEMLLHQHPGDDRWFYSPGVDDLLCPGNRLGADPDQMGPHEPGSIVLHLARVRSVTRQANGTVTAVVEIPGELAPPRGHGGYSIGPAFDPEATFMPDPDWREKIANAAEARELGAKLREGKPSSFGWPVGKRR